MTLLQRKNFPQIRQMVIEFVEAVVIVFNIPLGMYRSVEETTTHKPCIP
jgi:hypothetical protein